MPDQYKDKKTGISYTLGKPSIMDRLFGGMPEAYAYGRYDRNPIEFTKGSSSNILDKLLGYDLLGKNTPKLTGGRSIKVSVDKGDPQDTIIHEQMHSAFPLLNNPSKEEGLVDALLNPKTSATARSTITRDDANLDLIDRILNGSIK